MVQGVRIWNDIRGLLIEKGEMEMRG